MILVQRVRDGPINGLRLVQVREYFVGRISNRRNIVFFDGPRFCLTCRRSSPERVNNGEKSIWQQRNIGSARKRDNTKDRTDQNRSESILLFKQLLERVESAENLFSNQRALNVEWEQKIFFNDRSDNAKRENEVDEKTNLDSVRPTSSSSRSSLDKRWSMT